MAQNEIVNKYSVFTKLLMLRQSSTFFLAKSTLGSVSIHYFNNRGVMIN